MKIIGLIMPLLTAELAFADCEFQKVKFRVNELAGGIEIGSRMIQWSDVIKRSRKGLFYDLSVDKCGFEKDRLRSLLKTEAGVRLANVSAPTQIKVDGGSFKIFSVSSYKDFTITDVEAEVELSRIEDWLRFVEKDAKTYGFIFVTNRFPVSDEEGTRRWISLFEDIDGHRCVLELVCKAMRKSEMHGLGDEALFDDEKTYRYARHISYSTSVSITDTDVMSGEFKKSYMRRIESFVEDAARSFTVEDLYRAVKDCIVLISDGGAGSATGFIGRNRGLTYLYTNRHVAQPHGNVLEDPPLFVNGVNGSIGDIGRLWIPLFICGEYDVARYELSATRRKALEICEDVEINIGDKVYIFGNSDADVLTSIEGKVLGVGRDKIEVDAKFVKGNSGSPVFNDKGQVIGVVSFIKLPRKGVDVSGTRFADRRYFISRINVSLYDDVVLGTWKQVGTDRTNIDCVRRRAAVLNK